MVIDMRNYYFGKRVLITGHTGFKGSWLSSILVEWGADVYGYSLKPNTEPNLYEMSGLDDKITSYIGDVRDFEFLKKTFDEIKPQIVFHMAAQPLVRESYKNPVETFETNVMGTLYLLECIRMTEGIESVVNITTDKVYENKEWSWGYRENERLCGFDPYSNSKSCSELVTYSYKNSFLNSVDGLSVSTARSGNVIGGGDFSDSRIVPDCIRAVMKSEPIIVRNPNSTRPYQHVLDCLNGYLLLAYKQSDNPNLVGEYNFGPDDESCVTTGTLVDLFCSNWNEGASWENKWDGGPHEANFLKLDCTKSKTQLEWAPKWTINKAIEMTISFSKDIRAEKSVELIMKEQVNEYYK